MRSRRDWPIWGFRSPAAPNSAPRRAFLAVAAGLLAGGPAACGPQRPNPPPQVPQPADGPEVRVLLRSVPSGRELNVRSPRGGLTLADVDGPPFLRLDPPGARGRLRAGVAGLEWNGTPTGRARLEIASDAGVLELDGAAYRGRLRLLRRSEGGVAVVNVLPVEQYLVGVLRAEVPARFLPAAQRAMAIAARTYALYHRAVAAPDADFDLYAGELSQVYRGIAAEDAAARQAVERTRGIVLTAERSPRRAIFEPLYSSTCGGVTASASAFGASDVVAPLRGEVRCGYCAEAGSPYLTWPDVRIAKRELRERLCRRDPSLAALGAIESLTVSERGAGGRPRLLRLVGAAGRSRNLRPEEVRVALGARTLRSTWFEVLDDGEYVVFTGGRGFGHGVGLCQFGADGLARARRDAVAILAFYFPSSRPVRAY